MSQQGNILYSGIGPAGAGGGGNLPGVTDPFFAFAVGDGQAGSPVNGQTSLKLASFDGQSLVNKRLQPVREGIGALWNTPVATNDMRRFNSGGLGGWTFEPSGGFVQFNEGERWQVYISGIDNTIEV